MDKLSKLIQEARPLYKKRKRDRAIAKAFVVVCIPMLMLCSVMQLYTEGSKLYLSLDNNNLQSELLEDDFGLLR